MGGFAGVIILISLIWRFRFGGANTRRIIVLEYQRGIKFSDGKFTAVLEPGQYRINNKGRVDLIDMRPQPFLLEALSCEDKLGGRVVLSLAGEFAVSNPRLSLMSSRDNANEGPVLISKATRDSVSSLGVRDTTDATLGLLRTTLIERLNQELRTVGLEPKNIEITELWTASTRAMSQEFN